MSSSEYLLLETVFLHQIYVSVTQYQIFLSALVVIEIEGVPYNTCEFNNAFEYLRINISLTPLLEYAVLQYF